MILSTIRDNECVSERHSNQTKVESKAAQRFLHNLQKMILSTIRDNECVSERHSNQTNVESKAAQHFLHQLTSITTITAQLLKTLLKLLC